MAETASTAELLSAARALADAIRTGEIAVSEAMQRILWIHRQITEDGHAHRATRR